MQLSMYQRGDRGAVARSTSEIASPKGVPEGSLPSVSTVKEMTDGSPAADAARAT
jgi:hypothetical protein